MQLTKWLVKEESLKEIVKEGKSDWEVERLRKGFPKLKHLAVVQYYIWSRWRDCNEKTPLIPESNRCWSREYSLRKGKLQGDFKNKDQMFEIVAYTCVSHQAWKILCNPF